MTLRCIIIDDSQEVLDAAGALLVREGLDLVGVASNGTEGVKLVRELAPDVTLVDIDLGGESGLDVVRWLAPAPTILISTHAESDYAELIAASPALGFVPKSRLSAAAVRALVNGHRGT